MFKTRWFCGLSWLAGLEGFGALFRVGNLQLDQLGDQLKLAESK